MAYKMSEQKKERKIKFEKAYIGLIIIAIIFIWSFDGAIGFTEEKQIQISQQAFDSTKKIIDSLSTCREMLYMGKIPVGESLAFSMINSFTKYSEEQVNELNKVWSDKAHELCDDGSLIAEKLGTTDLRNIDFEKLSCREISWLIEQSSMWERNQWENELYKKCFSEQSEIETGK